jgi:RTX calcium-binding nonapeptide repeat (4 copies)
MIMKKSRFTQFVKTSLNCYSWQATYNLLFGASSGKATKRSRHVSRKRNSISAEQLENRQMFAVNFLYDQVSDILKITSDGASDRVGVSISAKGFATVKVNDVNVYSQYLSLMPISSLHFLGNGGDDFFENFTGISSTAYGGTGYDNLIGGSGKDFLYGDSEADWLSGGGGIDTLFGGTGNDVLIGNDGNDMLYGEVGADILAGGAGDDLLSGGSNNDTYGYDDSGSSVPLNWGRDTIADSSGVDILDFRGSKQAVSIDLGRSSQTVHSNLRLVFELGTTIESVRGSDYNDLIIGNELGNFLEGNAGNDRIYGRGNSDFLLGGVGDDGLYGGMGYDSVMGQGGDDRFLLGPNDTDNIIDFVGADDVKLAFQNGTELSSAGPFAGRAQDVLWDFEAGSWSDSQIEVADATFAVIQGATQNTRLLKRASDPLGEKPLTYVMQGKGTQVAGSQQDLLGIGGWNGSGGEIYFVGGLDTSTIYHELGHNWDDATELGETRRKEWQNISGWVQSANRPSSLHTASSGVNDNWWMRTDAAFAETYGLTNPEEDLATTFEAYFNRGNTSTAVRGDGTSLAPIGSTQPTADFIARKIAFLDQLFASLA